MKVIGTHDGSCLARSEHAKVLFSLSLRLCLAVALFSGVPVCGSATGRAREMESLCNYSYHTNASPGC